MVTSGFTLDQAGITEYHATDSPTRWSHLLNRPVPVSPTDTQSDQSASTVDQPVFPEPEIHVSKGSELDTTQRTDAESPTPTSTICGNAADSIQTEQRTTNTSSTLHVSSGDLLVSEISAVLKAKLTLTTTCGNSPDTIETEGPSSVTPATLCGNNISTDIPGTMHGNRTCEDMTKIEQTPSNIASKQITNVSTSIYYDILTPEEDDIVSISHDDIISNKCEVSLEKLSVSDLEEIKANLRKKGEDNNSSLSSPEETPIKKISLCPRKRPSTARMRAQKLITTRNAKIRRQEVTLKPYKPVPVIPTKEPTLPSTHDSSDDTIVYTPPNLSLPNPPTNRKAKAKFIIRTVGIKNYRDTETVVKANARKRSFKYYLCQQVFPRAKFLTTHFKEYTRVWIAWIVVNNSQTLCLWKSIVTITRHVYISVLFAKKHSHFPCRNYSMKEYTPIQPDTDAQVRTVTARSAGKVTSNLTSCSMMHNQ